MVKKFISAIMTIAMVVGMVLYFPPAKTEATTDYSGTYYIRNISAAYYLNAVSGTIGEAAVTSALTNVRNQAWTVTRESSTSDYYRIRSAHGNYYLTAQSNGSTIGTPVILTSFSSGAGQLWKFVSYQGGYKIVPKTNTSLVVSVQGSAPSGGSLSNNSQMYLTSATPGDGVHQEGWYMYKVQYQLSVKAFHDATYLTRYGSSSVSTRMANNMLALKKRLLETAGILLSYNNSYSQVQSYIDLTDTSCSAKNGVNIMCNCGTCVNSTSENDQRAFHHTNYFNNLYRLENATQSDNIAVYFIGHRMCHSAGVSHVANTGAAGVHGAINKNKDIAMIMDFQTETNHEQMMLVRTVLELYGLSAHSMNGEADCIFGSNANSIDVREVCTLCSNCQSVLIANAAEYNH